MKQPISFHRKESSKYQLNNTPSNLLEKSMNIVALNRLDQPKSYINIQLNDNKLCEDLGLDLKTFYPENGILNVSTTSLQTPLTHLLPILDTRSVIESGFQILIGCVKTSNKITIKSKYVTIISGNYYNTDLLKLCYPITEKSTTVTVDSSLISNFSKNDFNFVYGVDTYKHYLFDTLSIHMPSFQVQNMRQLLQFEEYVIMSGVTKAISEVREVSDWLPMSGWFVFDSILDLKIGELTSVRTIGNAIEAVLEHSSTGVVKSVETVERQVSSRNLLNDERKLQVIENWQYQQRTKLNGVQKARLKFLEGKKLKEKERKKLMEKIVEELVPTEVKVKRAVRKYRDRIRQRIAEKKRLAKRANRIHKVKLVFGPIVGELVGLALGTIISGVTGVRDKFLTQLSGSKDDVDWSDVILSCRDDNIGASTVHVAVDANRGLFDNRSVIMLNKVLYELFKFRDSTHHNLDSFVNTDNLISDKNEDALEYILDSDREIDSNKFLKFFQFVYMKYCYQGAGSFELSYPDITLTEFLEKYDSETANLFSNSDFHSVRSDVNNLLGSQVEIMEEFVSELYEWKLVFGDDHFKSSIKAVQIGEFSYRVAMRDILKMKLRTILVLMNYLESSRQIMNNISLGLLAADVGMSFSAVLAAASGGVGIAVAYGSTIVSLIAAFVEMLKMDLVMKNYNTINDAIELLATESLFRMKSSHNATTQSKEDTQNLILDYFNQCFINNKTVGNLKDPTFFKNTKNDIDYTNFPTTLRNLMLVHQTNHDARQKIIAEATDVLSPSSAFNELFGNTYYGKDIFMNILNFADETNKFYHSKSGHSELNSEDRLFISQFSHQDIKSSFDQKYTLNDQNIMVYNPSKNITDGTISMHKTELYKYLNHINTIEFPEKVLDEISFHTLSSSTTLDCETQAVYLSRYLIEALALPVDEVQSIFSMNDPKMITLIDTYYKKTYQHTNKDQAFIPYILGQAIKTTENAITDDLRDIVSKTSNLSSLNKMKEALEYLENIVKKYNFINKTNKPQEMKLNISYMVLKNHNATEKIRKAFPLLEAQLKKVYDAYDRIANKLKDIYHLSTVGDRKTFSEIEALMIHYDDMNREDMLMQNFRTYNPKKQNIHHYLSNATATQNNQDSDFMFFTKHMYNTCPLEYNDSKSDLYTNHSVIDFMKKTMQGGVVFSNGPITYTKFDSSYSLVEITIQKNKSTQSKEYKTTAIMYSNREDMKKNINYFLGVSVNGSKRAVNGFGLRLFQRIPIGEGKTEIKLPSVTITIDRSKNIDRFGLLFNDYIKLIMESDTSKHADIFNVSKHSTSSMLNYHPTIEYGETNSMRNKYKFYVNKMIGRTIYKFNNTYYVRSKHGDNYWYAPITISNMEIRLGLSEIYDLDSSGNNKNMITGLGQIDPKNCTSELVNLSKNKDFVGENHQTIFLISRLLDNPIQVIQGEDQSNQFTIKDYKTKNDVIIKFIKHGNDTKLKVGTLSVVTKDGGKAIHVLTESLESLSYRFPGFTKAHLQGCTIKYSDMSYNNINKFGNQYIKEYEMVVTDANDSFTAKQDVITPLANITDMYESNATQSHTINDNFSKVTVTRLGNILGSNTTSAHDVWKKESIASVINFWGMRAYYTYNGATRKIDYTKYPVGATQTITVDGKKRVQDKTTFNDGTTGLGPEYDSPVDKRTISDDFKHIVVTYKNGHKEFVTIYGRYAKSSSPTEKNMTAYDNAVVALATHSVDYERAKVDSKSNPSIGYTEYDDGTSTTDAGIAAANVANAANDAVNDVANAFGNAFGNTFGF